MNRQKYTLVFALVGLLFSLPILAAVYMEKDADGNTVFTDRPRSEKAKQVELTPSSTYSAPSTSSVAPRSRAPESNNDTQNYQSLSITSPADDTPLRSNNGALNVSVNLSPSLKAGHHFVLMMDGSLVAESQSATLQVQNVDRGSHTLQVQVIDDSGNEIISSETITIHMLRV